MSIIQKPNSDKLDPRGNLNLPSMEVPSFRYLLAQERKTIKNILIRTPFALGDCVCAEPTIRFAIKNFTGCEVSILTPFPELFVHLKSGLKKILNTKSGSPVWDDYFVLDCYYAAEALHSEFVQNFNMSIPDYIATCVLKGQLPVSDRNITLKPTAIEEASVPPMQVVIHPGRHWVSKTFPKAWYDQITDGLLLNKVQVAFIGADMKDSDRGTVDVRTTGCIDLRNKLNVRQSISVLQRAKVVLTNDSAPLHMAASGNAWIGFVSTVRHPDFVSHWRPNKDGKNEWAFKMHDFSKGRMWADTDTSPIRNGSKYDIIDQPTLNSWLPKPDDVVDWVLEKLADGRN